jgi:putative transposase
MKVIRGYKTELDLNNWQRRRCLKHAGAARFAYNWGLARRQEAYKATGETRTAIDLHKELNRLKKTDFTWMYEVSKCAPQEALRDLDSAYANFFRRVKLKKAGKLRCKVGYPKFKSRKHGLGSFRLTGVIKVFEGQIQLPRLGLLKLKERRYLPIKDVHIFSATVSEKAGRWFVSLQVEEEIPDPEPAQGEPVGVDLGITSLATCSDGVRYENPKALQQAQKKLRRLQRKLSRQQKGSNNCEKTRRKIAKLHYRVANLRRDALHKATSGIVAKTKPSALRPCAVMLEDLHVNGMLKNRRLAHTIADVGMYEFRRQMTYKAHWNGVEIGFADRWYPSSKMCSRCNEHLKDEFPLSKRTYRCDVCGLVLDRDLNAARNLVRLATTASSAGRNACGEDVRPGYIGQPSLKQEPNRIPGSA